MSDKSLIVRSGACWVYHAYNIGRSVNLKAAEALIAETKTRHSLQQKRRTKRYFEFHPQPVRVSKAIEPIQMGAGACAAEIDLVIFDFGAISIAYRFDLRPGCGLEELTAMNEALYEGKALLEHSLKEAQSLTAILGAAVQKPDPDLSPESYLIFQVQDHEPKLPAEEIFQANRAGIAGLLRSDPGSLSREEVHDSTDLRMSYTTDDLAVIDWDGALLFDKSGEDVRSVLEFVNVELMELRLLDGELDDALDEAYEVLQRWPRKTFLSGRGSNDLKRVGTLQVDSAMLFEGVNNALKLLSDQYLARVYRMASKRFHLTSWDENILRKLNVLQDIYDRMTDHVATVRVEVLEWIIILLIAISIVLPFVPGMPGGK
ncbi:MAG: hypothetical protein IT285_13135 [Bdellovibrionales bacterium]|nr:hypothetical protein [Bdellovibrionales bacterium]